MDKNAIVLKVAKDTNVNHEKMNGLKQIVDEDRILEILEAAGFFEAIEALKQIMNDLPLNKDWLNPMVEQMARDALRKAGVWDGN